MRNHKQDWKRFLYIQKISYTKHQKNVSTTVHGIAPFIQIFTYGGFGLFIAGITFRFWRRK